MDEPPPLECVFKDILPSCSNGIKAFHSKPLTKYQITRVETCSDERGDKFYKENLDENKIDFTYHTSCYATYTSKEKIEKYLLSIKKKKCERLSSPLISPPTKRLRSSSEGSFDFKKACFICGKDCSIVADERHPDRWERNPGVLCRTADRGKDLSGKERKSFKEVLLEICDIRRDILAGKVRIRLEGAVSDLHAADARYHKNCYLDFVNYRNIKAAQNQFDQISDDKEPFNFILRSIRNEPDRIWNSIELIDAYKEKGGNESNTSRLVDRIKQYMGDGIYCFKAPGVATVIMHQQKASTILELVGNQEEDEFIEIDKVAKQIKVEANESPGIKDQYPVLNDDIVSEISLPTLKTLLETISPKFKSNTKAVALISSMISSIANSKTSILQVALGLFVKEKKIIEELYKYGVTSSYDEVRRFKVSAAHFAKKEDIIVDSKHGLIQGISDNFDSNLSTQNGLKQTHSLASIVVQHCNSPCNVTREPIPRLKKKEVASVTLDDVNIKIHSGEKNTEMPDSFVKIGVLPLKVLCNQIITTQRSKCNDFQFLKAVVTNPLTPDYGGFNTMQARECGQSKKPKTTIMYKPLINTIPSDPSTILTAMCDIESVSRQAGQEVTIFTCDQQLYRVTMDIIWSNPIRWKDFYPRIGGMHWLMSFVGSIGKLMENSGLEQLMKSSFAGVEKMLLGKKFPMNVRALRIVVVELLRMYIDENTTCDDLTKLLIDLSGRSYVAEHWINNLVYPIMLIMLYVRAEREGEFGLHLYACKKMMPYFFAAGHWNYARDGIVYLRMMEKLPSSLLNKFMKGQHVVHLQEGFFNGIWSDMAIESTYMKIGKGPSGIIGITTNDRSVSIWANSHHLCSALLTELTSLGSKQETSNDKHKEESKGRIDADNIDRTKLRSTLHKCIHPLDIDSHACNKLVNIYSGEESDDSVNVNKALEIGSKQLKEFQESLPGGFRKRLSSKVITMTSQKDKSKKKTGCKDEFNSEILFSRVIYLLGTNQINLDDVFNYELAPVPTSLFHDSGYPRYNKTKNVLMNKLKVEESSRGIHPDTVVIDGGGMLHSKIHWPSNGLVKDLVEGVEKYLRKIITHSDVFLIFDRYHEGSIKSGTRIARIGAFRRSHQLTLNTELPPKDMCMSSLKTKECLIEIIAVALFEKFTDEKSEKRLIITSKSEIPEEINFGVRIKRHDLVSYYDEADFLIPQQVDSVVAEGKKVIKVISADTDVFVLLCSLFQKHTWSSSRIYMDSFTEDTKMISINKTVENSIELVSSLAALHALSGCDSVPMMFGIGKVKSLKATNEVPLKYLGDKDACIDDVIMEGKKFVAKCYGQKHVSSSKNRRIIWMNKTDGAKLSAKPPTLKSLPPTDEALELNIKRAHFAAAMWINCVSGHPPQMEPCQFGWELDQDKKTILPSMLPNGINIAPEEVLKITRCKCSASRCKSNQCSCIKATMSCTEYCGCDDLNCENRKDASTELDELYCSDDENLDDNSVEN